MKLAIKKAWITKLRSGRYKQTKNILKNKTGYCCLGVLRTCLPAKFKNSEGFDCGEGNGLLTRSAYDAAGLHHSTGGTLANMNDNDHTFNEIANYIEKRL